MSNNTKYKGSILLELDSLVEKNPNLSMGEIFYSFLRPVFLNGKHLLDVTDEEIFVALEKAKDREGEDVEMSEEEQKEFLNK